MLSSLSNPFALGIGLPAKPANFNTDAKTAVALNSALNYCVLPVFGESLAANNCPTPYTPINSGVLNFNIGNGGTYAAVDPLLGCTSLSGANSYTRVGDAIQGTGKFDRALLVPSGIGGSTIAMWADDSFGRIRATFSRLATVGKTATAVLMHIGANDNQAGTSQSDYAASQTAFFAQVRKYFSGPIFIAKSTMLSNVVSSGIQAAQVAAVTDTPNGIWLLGDCDSLTGSNRQGDGIHLSDTGSAAWAPLCLAGLQAYGHPFS